MLRHTTRAMSYTAPSRFCAEAELAGLRCRSPSTSCLPHLWRNGETMSCWISPDQVTPPPSEGSGGVTGVSGRHNREPLDHNKNSQKGGKN